MPIMIEARAENTQFGNKNTTSATSVTIRALVNIRLAKVRLSAKSPLPSLIFLDRFFKIALPEIRP